MGSERVVTVKLSVPALSYQWSVEVGEYDYQILCPGKSRVGAKNGAKIRMEKLARVRTEPKLKYKAEKHERERSRSFGEYSYVKESADRGEGKKALEKTEPKAGKEKPELRERSEWEGTVPVADDVYICQDIMSMDSSDSSDPLRMRLMSMRSESRNLEKPEEYLSPKDYIEKLEREIRAHEIAKTINFREIAKQFDNAGLEDQTKAKTIAEKVAEKVQICVDDEKAGLTLKSDVEIREITDWVNERNVEVNMTCDEVVYKFVIWLIMDLTKSLDEEELRVVKMGRKPLTPPVAHHWAVQVGERWYEITSKDWETRRNAIYVSNGAIASSGARKFGGEVVGKSNKTDIMIITWLKIWLCLNPRYDLLSENCQKLAYELMVWVTNKNYLCDHRVDAANINTFDSEFRDTQSERVKGFGAAKSGNAIFHLNQGGNAISSKGPINQRVKLGQFTAQAVAGPGLGAFVDVTLAELSLSAGNLAGFHFGLNANTGIGARNGNVEAHFLGFGGKIGADGVEVNSPVGGVNLCSLM